MDIEISSNTFTIKGNIKSAVHFQDIKNGLDTMIQQHSHIVVHIIDSISITSSVIGYLNKLILKDKINMTMQIQNPQVIRLLDDLNLMRTFNVRAVY